MSGLFGAKQARPTVEPTPKEPAPMPDSNSAGVIEARRKAQQDIIRRAGRSSTILTAPNQRGGDYASRTLGAG